MQSIYSLASWFIFFFWFLLKVSYLPLVSSSSLECVDRTKTAHRSPGRNRQTRAGREAVVTTEDRACRTSSSHIPKTGLIPASHDPLPLLQMTRFHPGLRWEPFCCLSQSSPTWPTPFGYLADKWLCVPEIRKLSNPVPNG